MVRSLVLITFTSLLAAPHAAAQDAYTACQSQSRVKLRATLASGGPLTLVVRDGEMATIASSEHKIGLSARLLGAGAVELRTWLLTRRGEEAERIAARGRFEARLGDNVALTAEATSGLMTSVEVVDVTSVLPGPETADAALTGRAKCCVTCSGTTACSSCWVEHDCGNCCAGTCCNNDAR